VRPGAHPGLHQNLQAAVTALQYGDPGAAEPLLDAVLAAEPGQPDAWHLRGILQHQRGAHDEAVRSIRHAIEHLPDGHRSQPEWLNNLGYVLLESGAANDAVVAFRESLEGAPNAAPTWTNLAPLLRCLGRGLTKPPGQLARPRRRHPRRRRRAARWHARGSKAAIFRPACGRTAKQ
jgi:Flp pilus assembly protein TadD